MPEELHTGPVEVDDALLKKFESQMELKKQQLGKEGLSWDNLEILKQSSQKVFDEDLKVVKDKII